MREFRDESPKILEESFRFSFNQGLIDENDKTISINSSTKKYQIKLYKLPTEVTTIVTESLSSTLSKIAGLLFLAYFINTLTYMFLDTLVAVRVAQALANKTSPEVSETG